MSVNPSRRLNKVYVVLLMSFPEEGDGGTYDSASVVYATLQKEKADDVEHLWDIVEKERYNDEKKVAKALNELKLKYHINCWSGEELRVEEEELQ